MAYHDRECWLLTSQVRSAAALVSLQAKCSPSDAVDRLMIRSAALRQDVEYISLDVLAGTVRFDH